MPRLNLQPADGCAELPANLNRQADGSPVQSRHHLVSSAVPVPPLLIDIGQLAVLLSRSVPSLHRDDAAGRLPAGVRIGGSKRWRYADIAEWVELGCPTRAEFEARRRTAQHSGRPR